MTRGVFIHRADSIYDDRPDERYQFAPSYLSRASQMVGDWVLFYEPVRAGARGYYAAAKVERITPDPSSSGMYLALIESGSYLARGRGLDVDVIARNALGMMGAEALEDDEGEMEHVQAAFRGLLQDDR